MKNLVKKSAVALAVASSLMVSGVASADSLLAPLVIGLNDGPQTYFSIKVRGSGAVNNRMASVSNDLHYVWFKKGAALSDLDNLGEPCEVSNNNGRTSPWDMVLQRAVGSATVGGNAVDGAAGSSATTQMNLDPANDLSQPNGYTAGDFVGFVTITDKGNANANPAVKDLANEGEMSGFGYVVDASNSFVLDYKLLNNHRSKVEGDFSAGFISKRSVDYSWMPVDIAATEWLTVVTGEDMLKADSGAGSYDATVYVSQDTASGSVSPQLPTGGSGVYNNDEKVTSGAKNFRVTCMGVYGRSQLLSTLQAADTVNGGWKRMSIQNSATRATNAGGNSGTATTQVASGAITYKAELIDFSANTAYGVGAAATGNGVAPELLTSTGRSVFGTGTYVNQLTVPNRVLPSAVSPTGNLANLGTPNQSDAEIYDLAPNHNFQNGFFVVSFQVETSGHLSASPEAHPNRPY